MSLLSWVGYVRCISWVGLGEFELQINSNQMNRTWKSIKRDSNKTKIYLAIGLLSDEVFNRCSNGQSLIYPQNQVESGWNENGWSLKLTILNRPGR